MGREELRKDLIARAKKLYGKILPMPHIGSFANSFTEHQGGLIFWFNTVDNSTRTIHSSLPGRNRFKKEKRHLAQTF